MSIDRENRIRLYGDGGTVYEVSDAWEGMDLGVIRVGHAAGGTTTMEEAKFAIDWKMARALADVLVHLADLHDPVAA